MSLVNSKVSFSRQLPSINDKTWFKSVIYRRPVCPCNEWASKQRKQPAPFLTTVFTEMFILHKLFLIKETNFISARPTVKLPSITCSELEQTCDGSETFLGWSNAAQVWVVSLSCRAKRRRDVFRQLYNIQRGFTHWMKELIMMVCTLVQ